MLNGFLHNVGTTLNVNQEKIRDISRLTQRGKCTIFWCLLRDKGGHRWGDGGQQGPHAVCEDVTHRA